MLDGAGLDALRGRRLLVVEDEYFIAMEIAQMLTQLGSVVVGPTGSADQARQLIEGEDLDGALLDINLGGQNAYPLADLLRARKLPFIFATGYDARSIRPDYADVPRCEKPVSPVELAALLAGLLTGTEGQGATA